MWLEPTLDALTAQPTIGYEPTSAPATEPTAIAAIALARHEQLDAANESAAFLANIQADDGSVGVRAGEPTPGWPTSLAVVAWKTVGDKYQSNVDRGVAWLLSVQGSQLEQSDVFGHNMQLIGWAWADGTHSWLEPTALAVLALKAAGHANHARTREAVRLILDRQLPSGGCNYGNTVVLGQRLRPHVQPTGMALVALSGPHAPREDGHHAERDAYPGEARVAKSIAWLRRSIGPETTAASLAWAILGLKAHDAAPPESDELLANAAGTFRVPSPHASALLALAAKGWPQ
jgi:hypothetical protein